MSGGLDAYASQLGYSAGRGAGLVRRALRRALRRGGDQRGGRRVARRLPDAARPQPDRRRGADQPGRRRRPLARARALGRRAWTRRGSSSRRSCRCSPSTSATRARRSAWRSSAPSSTASRTGSVREPLPAAQRTLPGAPPAPGEDARAEGARALGRVSSWSFEEMRDAAAGWATTLAAAGIEPGDRVAMISENRLELLELWLGCAWLGAAFVPINTALRGDQLGHVIVDSGARLLVVEQELAPPPGARRPTAANARAARAIGGTRGAGPTSASSPSPPPGRRGRHARSRPATRARSSTRRARPVPSKGVLCPQAQWYWWGIATGSRSSASSEDDVLYTCLPLFTRTP